MFWGYQFVCIPWSFAVPHFRLAKFHSSVCPINCTGIWPLHFVFHCTVHSLLHNITKEPRVTSHDHAWVLVFCARPHKQPHCLCIYATKFKGVMCCINKYIVCCSAVFSITFSIVIQYSVLYMYICAGFLHFMFVVLTCCVATVCPFPGLQFQQAATFKWREMTYST